jgi:hypothetical protein
MTSYIFNLIHKILKKIFFKIPLEGEIVSQLIQKELLNQKSVMISRFGSTEIKAILYPYIPFFLRHIFKKRIFENMYTLSGFFPSNDETIRKFSQMMIEDLKLIKKEKNKLLFMNGRVRIGRLFPNPIFTKKVVMCRKQAKCSICH